VQHELGEGLWAQPYLELLSPKKVFKLCTTQEQAERTSREASRPCCVSRGMHVAGRQIRHGGTGEWRDVVP